MSETQIYKWWWDQTRKRMKKLKNVQVAADTACEGKSTGNTDEEAKTSRLNEPTKTVT